MDRSSGSAPPSSESSGASTPEYHGEVLVRETKRGRNGQPKGNARPTGLYDAFEEIIARAAEAGVKKALNMSEATNKRLLTVEEAATYLGFSVPTIYNMIASEELRAVKPPKIKVTRLDIQDLDNWIARNKVAS